MIFIDSGPLIAWHLAKDAFHDKAAKGFARLNSGRSRMATNINVLDVTFSCLGRFLDNAALLKIAERIRYSSNIELVAPSREDLGKAIELSERYPECNFTACITAAVMKSSGISTIFTFNRNFRNMGLKLFR